ncbi:hypothetical protein ACIQF6_22020 [Kitasatospora sp. NPDC092948]
MPDSPPVRRAAEVFVPLAPGDTRAGDDHIRALANATAVQAS